MIDAAEFKQAMRRIVGGVSIIATRTEDGHRHGLTVTAVTAVSAEPPTVLCCVNRSASAALHIRDSGCFSVNVLPFDAAEFSQRFSGTGPASERFALGSWDRLVTGAPVLGEAIAAFDCRTTEYREIGSHFVFFGEVEATMRSETDARPLLYGMAGYGTFEPA